MNPALIEQRPFAGAPTRHDPPAACTHCIYHRITDAVETWAQMSLPADRAATWAIVSDLLNLKNMPPDARGVDG
ncbi:MAG: hypothetical protein WC130_11125 [Kiritimatiellia bacterium]|jgi:hypothetical protein